MRIRHLANTVVRVLDPMPVQHTALLLFPSRRAMLAGVIRRCFDNCWCATLLPPKIERFSKNENLIDSDKTGEFFRNAISLILILKSQQLQCL